MPVSQISEVGFQFIGIRVHERASREVTGFLLRLNREADFAR
jgi:hypothetical protein